MLIEFLKWQQIFKIYRFACLSRTNWAFRPHRPKIPVDEPLWFRKISFLMLRATVRSQWLYFQSITLNKYRYFVSFYSLMKDCYSELTCGMLNCSLLMLLRRFPSERISSKSSSIESVLSIKRSAMSFSIARKSYSMNLPSPKRKDSVALEEIGSSKMDKLLMRW